MRHSINLNKRGQIQMMEMVVVIVIFLFILSFGIIFFTNYTKNQTNNELSDQQRANLAETAKLVSGLPELHCSLGGDEKLGCIDLYRARAFADAQLNEARRLHYSEAFYGYSVELSCIYPRPCAISTDQSEGINDFTLMNYTDSGDQSAEFDVPVVIEDPITSSTGFGLLRIRQVSG